MKRKSLPGWWLTINREIDEAVRVLSKAYTASWIIHGVRENEAGLVTGLYVRTPDGQESVLLAKKPLAITDVKIGGRVRVSVNADIRVADDYPAKAAFIRDVLTNQVKAIPKIWLSRRLAGGEASYDSLVKKARAFYGEEVTTASPEERSFLVFAAWCAVPVGARKRVNLMQMLHYAAAEGGLKTLRFQNWIWDQKQYTAD